MKLSKAATAALAGTLIGVAGYSAAVPAQVQAKASYRVQITKNASVYTSKGKKTKKVYKKNKVLTAYKVRKIKGKYYYDLGKGKYVRTSYAMKYYYRTTTQSKKLVRTIKMYTPKGVKKVIQKAYIKRAVKTNLNTKKKTYGKWSTSSWKKYKVAKVAGYKTSRSSVGAAKVTYKRKNQTIKITYKLVKKAAPKKTSKPATKPSTTPFKPANSGASSASSKPATKPSRPVSKPSQPATKPSQPANSGSSSSNTGSSSSSGSSSSNTANNGGMAAQYKLETKDATITPGSSYNSTAFKVKYESTGKSAPSDVIKSVSVDNKAPFNVSVDLEYGVYNLKASPAVGQSGTYNVPVTVTYTDGTKETVTIKITVPALNYWTDATKASARTKLLNMINDFRSAVNVNPITMDTTPEYQTYMDQRAAEKAKQYAETDVMDHSGTTLDKKFGVSSMEDGGVTFVNASDSLDAQVDSLVAYKKNAVQAEKDDYEAINIRHERNYLTNPSGTVLHYTHFIDKNVKLKSVVIGIGTYTKGSTTWVATYNALLY